MTRMAYRTASTLLALIITTALLVWVVTPVHAATIIVNTATDENDHSCTDGDCSLRDAIEVAGDGDVITFSGNTRITLSSGELLITKTLTVDGGDYAVTVSGNDAVRAFNIGASGGVTLSHLSIISGTATQGGGIYNGTGSSLRVQDSTLAGNSADDGGGIYNDYGTLTLYNSTLISNSANDGGGIYNEYGILMVTNSTLSRNLADSNGGGIYSNTPNGACTDTPTTTVRNSTLSGNMATSFGGGIYNFNGVTEITYSTLTDNTAPENQGGGMRSYNDGATCTRVGDTLVAGNAGSDVAAEDTLQRFYSLDYNLIGVAGTNISFTLEFNQPHDQTNVTNPWLAPLANNGGDTWTHALLPGSPAIDAVPAVSCTVATDQRGVARPYPAGGACDIGAYENTVDNDLAINDVTLAEGNTGTTAFNFNIIRVHPSGVSRVGWATADGTAKNGSDYITAGGTVSFAAGVTSQTVTVYVYGDTDWESDERFYVNLTHPVSATLDVDQGLGTIMNDDDASGSGPGGVGMIDGNSNLELWLKGDVGVYSDSGCAMPATGDGAVACWADQSGNGYAFTGSGATWPTGQINRFPVIKFDATGLYYDPAFNIANPYTILTVSRQDGTRRERLISSHDINWLLGYWMGREDQFHAGDWVYNPDSAATGDTILYAASGDGTTSTFYRDGDQLASNGDGLAAPGQLELGGTNQNDWHEESDGKIAEVILYTRVLSSVQRTLVDNYLSARYAIMITDDRYAGDSPDNGDYDLAVAGIGQEADGDNPVARSAGLVLEESGASLDDGEYVLVGHKVADNRWTFSGAPSGMQRWARVWYVDKTGSVDVSLAFDFSESGVGGGVLTRTYKLLYSPTNAFSFADTGLVASIVGDQVQFTVPDGALADGYYTLGVLSLVLAKSVTPDTDVPYHGVVTYTLVLSSSEAISDTYVILTDTLPPGVDFGEWLEKPAGGLIRNGNAITWTGAVSASTRITITFTATHSGDYDDVITNTAHFSGTLQPGQVDVAFSVVCGDTLTVRNANDNGGGSLREAIADVCSGGVIDFAANYTLYLTDTLTINKPLTIDGSDHVIKISGDTGNDGSSDGRVFTINASGGVTLSHLSIISGTATEGGGIYNAAGSSLLVQNSTFAGNRADDGGGIFNQGTLTVQYSHFAGNSAYSGGGIHNSLGTLVMISTTLFGNSALFGGGAHNNDGTLTVQDSTLASNSAHLGGGIYSWSSSGACTATPRTIVRNSTLSGNSATGFGGGIFNYHGVTEIAYSTLTNNTAPENEGGGVISWNDGGTCTRVGGTLIAGNGGSDVAAYAANQSFYSLDYNLIGVAGTNISFTLEFNQPHDQTNVTNPRLAPLALYGGRTKTHALLTGSPALNAIPAISCTLTADQRGKVRPANALCDIGAFERQPGDVDGVAATFSGETPVGSGTGVSVTVTGGNPVTITVYKRPEWPGLSQNGGEFPILWTVMASGGPFTLTLKLCYTPAELAAAGVTDEGSIRAYRWNEVAWAWEDRGGAVDAGNNCVTVVGVTELSVWTLAGDGNAPTAVSLRGFVRQANLWLLLSAGIGALYIWRRKRR